MIRWVKSVAAVLLALVGGAAGDHFVFGDSSSSNADCSVHVTQATVRSSGEIAGCEAPSDAWLAHIEALVKQVRAELAEVETEIAEGE